MRLFIGIPLADSVQAALSSLIARLRPATNLRWSGPDSWHITLQFLGNTTPEQYLCLIARLAQFRFPPVPIHLGELGVFDRAGIFYAAIDPTPQLISLQLRVVSATALCGFEPESRPYHPHITLARSKALNRGRQLGDLQSLVGVQPRFPRFTAQKFLLYESHLSSAGSTYAVRHRFPLQSPGE
jgi:2'-5' RNA ligase